MKNHAEDRKEGTILEVRRLPAITPPICIHKVEFIDGKFAVVRCVKNLCFTPGNSITRDAEGWHYDNQIVKLLPFEYTGQTESDRRFAELR
ncbi:MAG: hypothetical protein RSD49_21410 [Hafnia sp.]